MKAVFEQLAEAHDLPKKQAHALQADFVAMVTTHLKQGDRIRMSGLGILEVKAREARMGDHAIAPLGGNHYVGAGSSHLLGKSVED
nr:MAG: hypothetical protein H1BulkLitter65330_000001 [Mitovirus sp.]